MQNQIPKNWPRHKLSEIDAIKHYIENIGQVFDETLLNVNPLEPADIEYAGVNFQVVKADFEFQKMLGVAKQRGSVFIGSRRKTRDQLWQDFILDPLRKKNFYGKSAKGIILLIFAYVEPPWVEEDLKTARSMETFINQLKTFGFDEIFLVLPKKNIRIYPKLL